MDTVFKIETTENNLAFGFRPWLRVPKITAECGAAAESSSCGRNVWRTSAEASRYTHTHTHTHKHTHTHTQTHTQTHKMPASKTQRAESGCRAV
jgi:hypothetical protein